MALNWYPRKVGDYFDGIEAELESKRWRLEKRDSRFKYPSIAHWNRRTLATQAAEKIPSEIRKQAMKPFWSGMLIGTCLFLAIWVYVLAGLKISAWLKH